MAALSSSKVSQIRCRNLYLPRAYDPFAGVQALATLVRAPRCSLWSRRAHCHSSDTFAPNFASLVNRGEKPMATWQAFVLGVMVAYTPSIVLLAFLLRSGRSAEENVNGLFGGQN